MDNAIQNMYQSELMFRRAFLLLAACALLICCLGILAMSISVCQKRVKEIGIRRVNGAKASEILLMLNSNLVKWVLVAFIISAPVSWYFMNLWLRSYAYKTPVSWWIFAIAGYRPGYCTDNCQLAELEGCNKKSGGGAEI